MKAISVGSDSVLQHILDDLWLQLCGGTQCSHIRVVEVRWEVQLCQSANLPCVSSMCVRNVGTVLRNHQVTRQERSWRDSLS